LEISSVIARVALEGYKHMEKEGRVAPEFVPEFEKRISDEELDVRKSRMQVDHLWETSD